MSSEKRFAHVHLRPRLTRFTTRAALAIGVALGIGGGGASAPPKPGTAIALSTQEHSQSDEGRRTQVKPSRDWRERGNDWGEEDTLGIGATSPSGVFLVYDAVTLPDARAGPPDTWPIGMTSRPAWSMYTGGCSLSGWMSGTPF